MTPEPATPAGDDAPVVVVGAGLAGLAAATTLAAAGRAVVVLEAGDEVGGRVRTDVVDGFLLDRGFQVVLGAYPEVARQLEVGTLRLRRFDPGALVWTGAERGMVRVGDPLRQPATLPATALAPTGSIVDKARVLALRVRLGRSDPAALLRGPDGSTAEHLRALGFSEPMVRRFFRPLFGGILLDPDLATSRRMFDVLFRTLAVGDAAVPVDGMAAIPRQLAARLPAGTVRLSTAVRAVEPGAVVLDDGTRLAGSDVVVATEGPAAARLLGDRFPGDAARAARGRSAACVWFAAPEPPVRDRLVVLDGVGDGPVLNLAVLTNVAPSYSPDGRALIAAACPGEHGAGGDDVHGEDLADDARRQLRGWFGSAVDRWEHLRTHRIAYAQPDQAPPFVPKRRVAVTDGLWVCGDHRDTGSIQGALFSGRRTAEGILAGGGW